MSPRYVRAGGVAVELGGGGGSLSDQWPSNPLSDTAQVASSVRKLVTINSHATVPHSPGTYVELDASLSADAYGVSLRLLNPTAASGVNTSGLLEIATGASGSEVVWATIAVGYSQAASAIIVPGFIAAGTRVAARVRSVRTDLSLASAAVEFLSATGKSIQPGAPVTMGVDTSTSRGVTLSAPGSTNTKGAWTEIEDSTSAAFGILVLCPQAAGNAATVSGPVLVDVGIGSAGSETVLVGDVCMYWSSSEDFYRLSGLIYGVDIPAGSRLSARYARASASNTVDLFLIGVPAA